MQAAALSKTIDPSQLADSGAVLGGYLPLAKMTRLTQFLLSDAGEVAVELRFGRDGGGRRFLEGSARIAVTMRCQRCLGACEQALQAAIRLGIVASEAEAERLPAEYDPLIATDRMRTLEMIEDELILALPLVAMHQDLTACVPVGAQQGGGSAAAEDTRRPNPFAVLGQLKNRNDRN